MINNAAVAAPPADILLWQFTGTRVTAYNGTSGGILGPARNTSEWIDTTSGTPAGGIVISASALSNGNQDFSVWLRHRR